MGRGWKGKMREGKRGGEGELRGEEPALPIKNRSCAPDDHRQKQHTRGERLN